MVPRIRMFGIELDVLRLPEALARVREWAEDGNAGCRYVVTPNVDHIVRLQSQEEMRTAYREASLVLADGQPIVWASRWLGRPLPERVAGSDLVPQLLAGTTAKRPLRVMLLGAAPGVGDQAAEHIRNTCPHVTIVAVDSPPLGFERDDAQNERILRLIEDSAPQVLIVGLGSPKQEAWVHRFRERIHANVALCVGATIDFLAGNVKRAPEWMRRNGLEWFYRLACEPRRLISRYVRDAWHFPQLVWAEHRRNRPTAGLPATATEFAGRRVE